jgi:hypothetical protein
LKKCTNELPPSEWNAGNLVINQLVNKERFSALIFYPGIDVYCQSFE